MAAASALLVAVVSFSFSYEAVCAGLGKNATPFPEKLFGTYSRKAGVPTKAILGPIAYDFLPDMKVLRDPDTNDVWFTLLAGQMWHVAGRETQYCFGPASSRRLAEQSPFSVDTITETSVKFCWRRGLRGMPTQTLNCFGCDCAKILLNLTDPDTLHFQFWMSPPVIHADVVFVRSGRAPSFRMAIQTTMSNPYKQCEIVDHYGPNVPNEPILTTAPPSTALRSTWDRPMAGGCAYNIAMNMNMKGDDLLLQPDAETQSSDEAWPQCHQLNGINLQLDKLVLRKRNSMNVSDVKVQFVEPKLPCDPCDVSYSVSAKIADDEYIAVGFKGRSWERDFPYAPEHPKRPCYFGMCVDSFDNFTSDRIALGYTANGGCFREMVAKDIVGAPEDADYKTLRETSVTRSRGRTILRFTVSQRWQPKLSPTYDGPFRIMWATGKVTSGTDACTATIGYHLNKRGVAPLLWLKNITGIGIGSTPCIWSEEDTNHHLPTIV